MTALIDLSDYLSKVTGANVQQLAGFKTTRVAGALSTADLNLYNSLWLFEGYPGAGAVPTTVVAPDNTTNGSLLHASPGGGRSTYLTGYQFTATNGGSGFILDRLLHIGGLSGTVTTPQTVGGALTRNTDGLGNRIFAEIYTTIGVTGTTITASYTNQAGASKTTVATTFGSTNYRDKHRFIELPLAAGDTGVKAVASCTVLATTGTAGNFGITVVHPVGYYTTYSDHYLLTKDFAPVDVTNSCLFLSSLCAGQPDREWDMTLVES